RWGRRRFTVHWLVSYRSEYEYVKEQYRHPQMPVLQETDLSIIVPRSIHSQESLPLYEKPEKQPWHHFRFEAPYATQVLSIERPGRNRHFREVQTEWHENRQTILLLREQKRASEEHQHVKAPMRPRKWRRSLLLE